MTIILVQYKPKDIPSNSWLEDRAWTNYNLPQRLVRGTLDEKMIAFAATVARHPGYDWMMRKATRHGS
jgi:hypothetical protein